MRAITKAKIDHIEFETRDGETHLVMVLKNVEYKELPDPDPVAEYNRNREALRGFGTLAPLSPYGEACLRREAGTATPEDIRLIKEVEAKFDKMIGDDGGAP